MLPSREPSRKPDWRAVLALAWALGFGTLYTAMIVRTKAPGVAAAIGRLWRGDEPASNR